MRNYHREDYAEEQELVALELESCETVCDEAADERLDKSAGERKDKGIKESGKVVVVLYYSSIGVERRVFGISLTVTSTKSSRPMKEEEIFEKNGKRIT